MHDQDTQPIVLRSCDAERPPSEPGDLTDPPVVPDKSTVSAWGVFGGLRCVSAVGAAGVVLSCLRQLGVDGGLRAPAWRSAFDSGNGREI